MRREIITRAEAKARGLKRYFTGDPCVHGHVCDRVTRSGVCHECEKARNRKAYARRSQDPDFRKKKSLLASQWTKNNRERARATQRRAREKNREKYLAAQREYHRRYRQKNPEPNRMRARAWRAKNRERAREMVRRYHDKISDLISILRAEMPELLKEFGL